MFNIDYSIVEDESGHEITAPATLSYRFIYRSIAGVPSRAKQVDVEISESGTFHIVFSFLPGPFDESITAHEVYRLVDGDYRLIGKVEADDEGIFVDDNSATPGNILVCDDPFIHHYESHVRWSEPFLPNKIRPESLATYRIGDGDQITGLASLYGNLLVFKQNSIHRVAVQADSPPISRTDEVSPDVGCIAPESLITVNNNVYFLSWQGFMRYDNNVLHRADTKFNEELMYRLQHSPLEHIEFASCGWNEEHGELYLNVPFAGTGSYHGFTRIVRGHLYVMALEKGYVTKFTYESDVGLARDALSFARLYHNNSVGELMSGEIFPPGTVPALISREAPGDDDFDEVYDAGGLPVNIPIHSYYRSKAFAGGDEGLVKRVRNVVVNFFAGGTRTVRLHTIPDDNLDDRIDNEGVTTEYDFSPAADPYRNVLRVVPDTIENTETFDWDDSGGKPVRVYVELEGEFRSQINAVAINWRPIHPYLS